jgi:cytochrome c-type biogenesis protein
VLPLIPSYLCVIGGPQVAAGAQDAAGKPNPRLVARTAFFILGLSSVFIKLSIAFQVAFGFAGPAIRWLNWISGAIVIVFGLNIIFDFLSFLNYEKRLNFSRPPRGFPGVFLVGAAFGAGWTPCVGPVLASILMLAAQSGNIPQAVLYLACYSAGFGLPFLLASVFFNVFMKTSAKLRPHLPLIRKISGALLVVLGALIITGHFQALGAITASWQGIFSR